MTSEAYQELGPVIQTALAQQLAPQSQSLAVHIEPATRQQFGTELTACLALVVPVGMTEEARREWLAVAWASVGHLPPDLLAKGCAEARKVSDHPAKIVPAIIAATEAEYQERKQPKQSWTPALPEPVDESTYGNGLMDRRGQPMSAADTERLNEILAGLGAVARYREDGSRYTIEDAA